MIPVFVGYDPREAVAFSVFVNSMVTRSSSPVSITPLALNTLDTTYKEGHTDGSNAFIYSRFLVPYLCNFQGYAIFADGDMVLTDDIAKLWDMRDPNKAVQVVKHDYQTAEHTKYLGAKNEDYPRKNWSSLILWNCSHPANRLLLPWFIEQQSGAYLHRFSWLADEEIGDLPVDWNWLAIEYPLLKHQLPPLIHYTLGTPCFLGYHDRDYASVWYDELFKMLEIPDSSGADWLERG